MGAVKAARDQTELWIVAERRRAKDALMSIVEEEARRAAYREHEQQRQAALAAAQKKALIDGDTKRRARLKAHREALQARRDKKLALEQQRIVEVREKLEQQAAGQEARHAARSLLVAQELKRRSQELAVLEKVQSMRRQALIEQKMEAAIASRNRHAKSASTPALKPLPAAGRPKTPLKEDKISIVKRRAQAEQEERTRQFEEKLVHDKERTELNTQLRHVAAALRRAATAEREKQAKEQIAAVQASNEAFKQSVAARLKQRRDHVDAMHEQKQRQIEEALLLSKAHEEEKARRVERVERARAFELKQLTDKSLANRAKVVNTNNERSTLSSASRRKAEVIHYEREELKEKLLYSQLSVSPWLRKESSRLSAIGINASELEDAHTGAGQSLRTSLSAPHLRPSTAPSAPTLPLAE